MLKTHCIIVGAGAAGLMAARELATCCRVTILEARDRPGGRIRTLPGNDIGSPVEMGAEFVHGNLPLTLGLLKEAGLDYTPVEGNMYRVVGGEWKTEDESGERWEKMLQRMQQEKEDSTLSVFLNKYYDGKEQAAFRENVVRFARGFDLADPATVSMKGLCQEWMSESDENFRIRKGYGAMMDFLVKECVQAGCDLQMGRQVKEIVWEEGKVTVLTEANSLTREKITETSVNAGGKLTETGEKIAETASFTGDKIIVTVPLGILQDEHTDAAIQFIPAIDSYRAAARSIGWGTVIKMIVGFSLPFWNDRRKVAGFIISDEPIGTWWTSGPGEAPRLTGWLGGPPAEEWSQTSEEALLERGLRSLSALFKMDVSLLQSLCTSRYLANWRTDKWAMGAYSYPTPATSEAKKLLNTPLHQTLYFAGEALYEGDSPGTVEAALESGKGVAAKIRESILFAAR